MAEDKSTGGSQVSKQSARRAAWALYMIVFTGGAVLMGIEIAGSRILAPSFGTGIFVWGALIGLFMGAMAAGYWVGGRLADRYPSFPVLATIVSLAGVYTFLMIPYLGPYACEEIARSVTHPMWGPLIAAFLLFFVPSFLLAMVSPYAVKLNTTTLSGVGGVAGSLYALSTFGSIVGTLATTFFLVPMFFVSNVLLGLGLLLVVIAILTLVLFRSAVGSVSRDDRNGAALMAIVALALAEIWALFPAQPRVAEHERVLYYEESQYHDIAVSERVSGYVPRDYTPVGEQYLLSPFEVSRWLKFNENRESGIYPYGTYKNAVRYTNVIHLALLWAPEPKRMLVVGGGGGVIPVQFQLFYPSLEKIDVLELDPSVERAANKYFQMERFTAAKGGPIEFHIGDARMNLKKLKDQYDIILLDAYSSGGQIPYHLLTYEFLRDVTGHLTKEGILVTNIIAAVENESTTDIRAADLFFAEYKTLTGSPSDGSAPLYTPDQIYVFPRTDIGVELRGRESENRNIIVFATRDQRRKTQNDLISLAKAFSQTRKPENFIHPKVFLWHAENVYRDGPTPNQLADIPVLEDDFAPVDTMYRPVKRDEAVWRLR